MGISISEIQDATLLKYAKEIDDGDGELNEVENNSLFETLNSSIAKYQQRLARCEENRGIGDDIFAGIVSGGLTSLFIKKARNFNAFVTMATIGTLGYYVGDIAMIRRNSNKIENLNSAKNEFNKLMLQSA